ncbi:hypothetical protein ACTXM8_10385 [Brachybacterium alimentarium]|uniref:hypothetical protein n=1 Tax=Brachybacterium alimentarium TaxID=47845 RepID=UPI003FD5057E
MMLQIRSTTWVNKHRDGTREHTPGILIRNGRSRVFVPMAEAEELAEALDDILEDHEAQENTP